MNKIESYNSVMIFDMDDQAEYVVHPSGLSFN